MNLSSVDMGMVERKFILLQNAIGFEVLLKPVFELEPPSPVVEPDLFKLNTLDFNKLILLIFGHKTLHILIQLLASKI